MTLRRRLEAPERRSSSSDSMTVINILGGLPEPYLKTATAGPHWWLQEPGESLDAFRERVLEIAEVRGEHLVFIGGLPDEAIKVQVGM